MDRVASTTDSDVKKPASTHSKEAWCKCPRPVGRNLVVCIDGTSNQFGPKNTNVIALYSLVEKNDRQLTFYDSGIGTYARKGWRHYRQMLDHKIDLAIAWNFEKIVLIAYEWLSENYRPNDRIFLFGFSRGAYQVRCLSAMIHNVGLIFRGNQAQIPFAYKLYADIKDDTTSKPNAAIHDVTFTPRSKSRELADEFKSTFAREVKVHFVGVWDTVSSVGMFRKKTLPDTTTGMKHVCLFRHALALDERRVKFLPEYAYGGITLPKMSSSDSDPDQVIRDTAFPHTKEVWFVGSHSDIGGGNVKHQELHRPVPPLRWMCYEATAAGLRMRPLEAKWGTTKHAEHHPSLTPGWWPFELLPWKRLSYRTPHSVTWWPHLGGGRRILPGQMLHSSIMESGIGASYTPRASFEHDHDSSSGTSFTTDWQELLDIKHREVELPQWIEQDLYHLALRLMKDIRRLLTDPNETDRRRPLQQMLTTLIDSPQGFRALGEVPELFTMLNSIFAGATKFQGFQLFILRAIMHGFLRHGSSQLHSLMRYLSIEAAGPLVDKLLAMSAQDPEAHEIALWLSRMRAASSPGAKWIAKDNISIALSPDQNYLALGSYNSKLHIYHARPGSDSREISSGHTRGITALAYSPDGKHIVSGSYDCTVSVTDANTGRIIRPWPLTGHTLTVSLVVYSPPSGTYIVSGSHDATIRVWHAQKGTLVAVPEKVHDAAITSGVFSRKGQLFATGSLNGIIHVWNFTANNGSLRPKTSLKIRRGIGAVLSLSFAPNMELLACGSYDKNIYLWNIESRQLQRQFLGHADRVRSIVFSPNSRYLVSGSDDLTIRVWDSHTGTLVLQPFSGHKDGIWTVAYSSDGKRIVSCSIDGTLLACNAETGALLAHHPFRGHTDEITCAVFSADGHFIASGSKDNTVRLWNAHSGDHVLRPLIGHQAEVLCVKFSPSDRRLIASGSADETIRLWDASTDARLFEPLRGHSGGITSIAFSPDGKDIASASQDHTIRVWKAQTGESVFQLSGHNASVTSVAFLPSGNNIISSSTDKTIRLWDAVEERKELQGEPIKARRATMTPVVFSLDSTHIATAGRDGSIIVWTRLFNSASGWSRKNIPTRPKSTRVQGVPTALAFSPAGNYIAAALPDKTIHMWDVESKEEVLLTPLQGHSGTVSSIEFSIDGRRILSASHDKTIHVWDAKTGQTIL